MARTIHSGAVRPCLAAFASISTYLPANESSIPNAYGAALGSPVGAAAEYDGAASAFRSAAQYD